MNRRCDIFSLTITGGSIDIGTVWNQLLAGLSCFAVCQRRQQVVHLPSDVHEDVHALFPSPTPHTSWIIFVVGDILLARYGVPKGSEVSTRGLFSFLRLTTVATEKDK